MPAKIKVKVLAGRNLPVMDRAGDTTDAFVEIKFGGVTHKTDVCRKSLNPHWNSTEWYRFEVEESDLQDEPLQLRVMDHDTYSANDAIGKVVISLAPLLARDPGNSQHANNSNGTIMSGWVPVYDTMHGIRGELNIIVKVELFSDFNKFRQSSCGVQFFHCPSVPPGYKLRAVHGFVEELIVNDDPEYQWIDKIRTPRASNEARQVAFIKLTNEVQRRVGVKAGELGGNAVVGYTQALDLEGEAGVVARAHATAVTLSPLIPLVNSTSKQQKNIQLSTPAHAQMKKYLDMLGINEESELNSYFQSHQDELCKLLDVMHPKSYDFLDENEQGDDSQSFEITRETSLKNYANSLSIYRSNPSKDSLQNLVEDEMNIKRLLNPDERETRKQESGSNKAINRLKNLLPKRGGSSKPASNNDDSISIQSTSSNISHISLSDLKSEFRKLKRIKKPKLRVSGGVGGTDMASVLVRSVLHANTSLQAISEQQESASSTLRRSSQSEPQFSPNVLGEPKNSGEMKPLSKAARLLARRKPRSPLLSMKLDQTLSVPFSGSTLSALSAESSEQCSSSDDEDYEMFYKTREDEDNLETVSLLVQNVLDQQKSHDPKKVNENVGTAEENPVSSQLNVSKRSEEESNQESKKSDDESKKSESNQIKIKSENPGKEVKSNKFLKEEEEKPGGESLKLDEDSKSVTDIICQHKYDDKPTQKLKRKIMRKQSKSISMPSSPVDRSRSFCSASGAKVHKDSKVTKIIKSLSHLSLARSHKKQKEEVMSVKSSVSSEKDTVLGSPFMSYADLMALAKQQGFNDTESISSPKSYSEKPFDMFIGSDPPSRTSSNFSFSRRHSLKIDEPTSPPNSKPPGLIATAMETILMDKLNELIIPLPTEDKTKQDHFFDQVNKKLEKIEEMGESFQKENRKKFERQDSVRSNDAPLYTDISRYRSSKAPILQHLHPLTNPACSNLHANSLRPDSPPPIDHDPGRRASDSDLSTTPKGVSVMPAVGSAGSTGGGAILKPSMNTNNLEMLEYPFLTMTDFPPGFIVHLGGTVCARSVKLIDGGEAGSRAAWWAELRTELRAHARALRCSAVIGYNEAATISDDVCILSASGTAAVINLDPSILAADDEKNEDEKQIDNNVDLEVAPNCALTHVPYSVGSMPYRAQVASCAICGKACVPSVLVCTAEVPASLPVTGRSCLVTASATRARRAPSASAEPAARDLSDQLPFLEYELHRLLIAKLRMQGANALFGLKTIIAVGEKSVIALASGTGVYASSLPPPREPMLKPNDNDDADELRKALRETLAANRIRNGYEAFVSGAVGLEPDDGGPALDLGGDKDACVLELDDAEDADTARTLATSSGGGVAGVACSTTGKAIGVKSRGQAHAFTQVWRGRATADRALARVLAATRYKLRRLAPFALTDLRFHIDLPEDELQVRLSGIASRIERSGDEGIFSLEEETKLGSGSTGVTISGSYASSGVCICALRLLFVRETTGVREAGGLSGFLHAFLSEALAVTRAHTHALGGNTLAACHLAELVLHDNPHKNQAQCLLSIGGDVVHV